MMDVMDFRQQILRTHPLEIESFPAGTPQWMIDIYSYVYRAFPFGTGGLGVSPGLYIYPTAPAVVPRVPTYYFLG